MTSKHEKESLSDFFQDHGRKMVLHCCCAPCSCSIIERLLQEDVEFILFFYNPNIHPQEEYEQRKQEVVRYAHSMGIAFADADYDADRWLEAMKGHEMDSERGERCSLCFELRLLRTAAFAATNGYPIISTTLGISRRKNVVQVAGVGRRAAAQFPGVVYLDYNWRKGGGIQRADEIIKEQGFYRQSYCGCRYSIRDTKKTKS